MRYSRCLRSKNLATARFQTTQTELSLGARHYSIDHSARTIDPGHETTHYGMLYPNRLNLTSEPRRPYRSRGGAGWDLYIFHQGEDWPILRFERPESTARCRTGCTFVPQPRCACFVDNGCLTVAGTGG